MTEKMKKGTKQLSVDCILWATAITVFVIANDNDVCEQLISMEKSRKLITQRLKIPLLKTENNNSHTHTLMHAQSYYHHHHHGCRNTTTNELMSSFVRVHQTGANKMKENERKK